MDTFIYSFNVVVPVFLLIVLGFLLKRIKLLNESFVNTAVKFNFRITLPTLIFNNIYSSNFIEIFDLKLMLFVVGAILGVVLLLWPILTPLIPDRRRMSAMMQAIFRSNFLLLGLPLAINMFGPDNISTISFLIPIAIPLFNLLAVIILAAFAPEGEGSPEKSLGNTLKAIATNPLIVAALLSLLFQAFAIRLPKFLESAVSSVASIATPLALIALGGQLNIKSVASNLKYSLSASLARLIAVPFVVVSAAVIMGFRGTELGSIFILFASPPAVSCFIMAKEMNSDYELTADIILIGTTLSLFTIFFGVYLLRSFALI